MPFIPITDGAEAVVTGTIGSVDFVNVFGYRLSGPLTSTIANHIGGVLNTCYGYLVGAVSTAMTWHTCVVTDLQVITGSQFTASSFGPVVGTDTANPLPYQTAGLISWSTDTRGRSYRGRTFLAPFCEDHSNGRDLSADLITALGNFRDHLVADGDFAILSRFELNPTPPPATIPRTAGLATPITAGTVHPLWRTQRRRATH